MRIYYSFTRHFGYTSPFCKGNLVAESYEAQPYDDVQFAEARIGLIRNSYPLKSVVK